jgi:hypothetical protein
MTAAVGNPVKPPLWWRVARGTVRGTLKVAKITYVEGRFVYGVTKTKTQARYRRWKVERNFSRDETPEVDEVPRKRRRLFRAQYLCFACNRKFSTPYGLNKHFQNVHAAESKRPRNRAPEQVKFLDRNGRERTLVRLVRPATTTTAPRRTSTTSTRSANPMNSSIAMALRAAWATMRESRPMKLSEIRDDMVGLEQILGAHAAEAISAYRAHLVRNVGFNPITVQRLVKAIDQLEEAGKSFSAVIAAIDEYYADDIAAAKKRKGGERPSDQTLAN